MRRVSLFLILFVIASILGGCNFKKQPPKQQINDQPQRIQPPRGYRHPYSPYPIGRRDCITIQMQNGLLCNTCTSCPEGISVSP